MFFGRLLLMGKPPLQVKKFTYIRLDALLGSQRVKKTSEPLDFLYVRGSKYEWLHHSPKMTGMHMSKAKLIHQLKSGEPRAIEFLYDEYADTLYGIVVKIVEDEGIAQDVIQESFVKIWRNGYRFDPSKGTLFTWMLNICRNCALDKRRLAYNLRKQQLVSLEYTKTDQFTADLKIEPDHLDLKQIIDRLENKYQVIIELSYFQGYTQQEISDLLEIPLGTVKSRIRIALKKLKNIFIQLVLFPEVFLDLQYLF